MSNGLKTWLIKSRMRKNLGGASHKSGGRLGSACPRPLYIKGYKEDDREHMFRMTSNGHKGGFIRKRDLNNPRNMCCKVGLAWAHILEL
jgi:hypothetical protein